MKITIMISDRGMPVESRSSMSRRGVVIVQSMYRAYQIDLVYGLMFRSVCKTVLKQSAIGLREDFDLSRALEAEEYGEHVRIDPICIAQTLHRLVWRPGRKPSRNRRYWP